jgi:hypothetical protein
MINWKGFGRKQPWPNQGTVPAFTWRDYEKPQNPSVMIAGSNTPSSTLSVLQLGKLTRRLINQRLTHLLGFTLELHYPGNDFKFPKKELTNIHCEETLICKAVRHYALHSYLRK